jgi:hypothetical protein
MVERSHKGERFWILVPGASALLLVAALLAWSVRDETDAGGGIVAFLVLLLAPFVLAAQWVAVPHARFDAVPEWVLMMSLIAVGGVASHPIAPGPSTRPAAVIGFLAWAACTLLATGLYV